MVEYVKYKTPKRPKLYKFGKYSISQIEIKHLSLAFVLLAATLFVGILNTDSPLSFIDQIEQLFTSSNFITYFSAFILAFGLGFLLHEFAHKFVAQHYGFISEFRADLFMLIVTFCLALAFNIIFLAPGAVIIMTRTISRKQNGIISVAGPLVNLGLVIIGFLIALVFQPTGFLGSFAANLILINTWLGAFNMLPFWILDGKKVWDWNKPVYISVMGIFLLLFFWVV